MIDIPADAIVLEQRSSDGRFILFTNTDRPADFPIPWNGACLDTLGDAHGILLRCREGDSPDGWAPAELLAVLEERARAEYARRPAPLADRVQTLVERAHRLEAQRQPNPRPVDFRSGAAGADYLWTDAYVGDLRLSLCPDAVSRGEGVSPEQLLMVLLQFYMDLTRTPPADRTLLSIRLAVSRALDTERRRLAVVTSRP